MPEGIPTPAQLLNGEISFFSIDTDVIQSAGYSFEAGALNQLHRQLPSSMELQLTDIVANEIIKHLMDPVLKSIQTFESSLNNLKRRAELPLDQISDLFRAMTPTESASAHFRKRLEDYASKCRGGVLPTEGDGILTELFNRYFNSSPPFELNAAKKTEFPDATSLLVLEKFATNNETTGIVISKDNGWEAFAAQSEYLYCVKSLDELTALFTATGALAAQVHEAINKALEDEKSPLRSKLSNALEDHLHNASWSIGEIYSNVNARVEGEVSDIHLSDHDLLVEKTSIWNDEEDPTRWLIEVTASVQVNASISVVTYLWDSIDKEEVELESDNLDSQTEIEVSAFLTCSNVEADSAPTDWDIEVEIAPGDYEIDVGEVQAFPWD
ncbi:PIN domain-containing protein [Pseudomonas sediminis]|uniref:DUF4935 domain-containing protein n=1 Tax=Pseudomonas sediminis TaxID=1691904 RepID=A0A2G5FRH1_9PSED|nr:PIN domain-containing protein [Pseudomonas sediminis]PIA70553.1 hypothetical protein CDO35_06060 [Pseudomonas sediminis]